MDDLQKYLEKKGLTTEDIKNLIEQTGKSEPKQYMSFKLPFNEKRVKFGVLSDLHMGHKEFRQDILEHAAKYFKQQKIEFILMPGDIIEGMSGREGHIYELSHIGAQAQLKYGVEQLSKLEQQIYGITATNSHDGWYSSKNNMGFEVGLELDSKLNNFKFLGYDEADLILDNGLKLRMTHPGDGVAYAISYKMQKYLNAMSGGEKPHCLFQGHYHKAEYIFYRNVHGFDAGTLEGQTIFMKKKQTPAMLGYWVIDLVFNKQKKEVDKIRPEFVPFY